MNIKQATVGTPTAFITALTGATTATVNLIALLQQWPNEVVASVNMAAGAWIVVLGWVVDKFSSH